jgi:hypothetical protein
MEQTGLYAQDQMKWDKWVLTWAAATTSPKPPLTRTTEHRGN